MRLEEGDAGLALKILDRGEKERASLQVWLVNLIKLVCLVGTKCAKRLKQDVVLVYILAACVITLSHVPKPSLSKLKQSYGQSILSLN